MKPIEKLIEIQDDNMITFRRASSYYHDISLIQPTEMESLRWENTKLLQ